MKIKQRIRPSTVSVIILRYDGSALLQHRDNCKNIRHPNMWGPPGGHLEKNETIEQCAFRELEEETGYRAKEIHFLRNINDGLGNEVGKIAAIFWGLYDYTQTPECKEGQNLQFISREYANTMNIAKYNLQAWDDAYKNAKQIYDLSKPKTT